jgi:hypothetical protein
VQKLAEFTDCTDGSRRLEESGIGGSVADHIEGWWTIGEAPNYEVNDDGVVRHKASGRSVKQYRQRPNSALMVMLSAGGKTVGRRIQDLIENGRKYQGAYDGEVGEDHGGSDLRSEYRRKS